jgi:allantoinase
MHQERFDDTPIVKRPPLKWPNDAPLAVWIISNIEYHEFDGPGVGISPPRAFPDTLNWGWRDYSLRVGVWRFMEMLDTLRLRCSVALNAKVCDYYPDIIKEGNQRNWEWMGHGITNSQIIDSHMGEEEERSLIRNCVEKIAAATGKRPQGWLGPALSETLRTPDVLAENGITYLCDFCNDDQPYALRVKKGRLIQVPYSLEINDIPFFVGTGRTGKDFGDAIKDQFDVLYEEGKRNGRVMAIALHPFLTSVPHRHKHLKQALEYLLEHRDVWFTTGAEIADWYYRNYYK